MEFPGCNNQRATEFDSGSGIKPGCSGMSTVDKSGSVFRTHLVSQVRGFDPLTNNRGRHLRGAAVTLDQAKRSVENCALFL